ncbi:ABC heavy metal transporter [Xylaria curta]|nr:ABC heavy metal transporter [Xylaria curta]
MSPRSDVLFWAHPASLYVCYALSHIYYAIRLRSASNIVEINRNNTKYIQFLHSILVCVIGGAIAITFYVVVRSDYGEDWYSKNYLSSTTAVWLFYLAALLPDPHSPYTASSVSSNLWLLSLLYETACLAHHLMGVPNNRYKEDALLISLAALRIAIFLALLVLYHGTKRWPTETDSLADENCPLLRESSSSNSERGHNSKPLGDGDPLKRQKDAQTTTWIDYVLGFSQLFPFLWPVDSRRLQIRAIVCFGLLIAQRIINILAPHQLGIVVATLGSGSIPHKQILLYILYRGLQGQQGVIGSIRALLWIPISQSTYRRLSSSTFAHVLQLSLDFHISKRVGEVMSALSKGGALNTFLDGFAFQLFPMVADLWIAAGYFWVKFDAFYSLMVIAITWFYIYITIYMAVYRGRARREMALREREMEAAKTDALLSYETVHHCGAIHTEMARYEGLMRPYQKAEYRVFFSLNLLNAVQNGVFTLGTLLLCYLNAFQISINLQQVPMFVTLLVYLAQLQAPLNFFGSFYTQVQNNLVDAERMLELFKEQPTVTDKPDAINLTECEGKVSFSNVSFTYSGHQTPALRDVSFDIPPGSSTAIVGESGSGKSTIFKLLFRFYDVSAGSIMIDNMNIRNMQMESLRSQIGVVPQDIILFNDSLMNNIKYSRPEASKEQIHRVCDAASIHDKILEFPHKYSTVVGERGLKLSGGERQRIAMARAFLKSPRILMLDEATSSLDSATEKLIQDSLEKVSRGRTTITIAHRLSTITKADQIIVLQRGRVVEKGNHQDLLARKGVYSQMWEKQTQTTDISVL